MSSNATTTGRRQRNPRKICPNCGDVMKGANSDVGWVDEMETLDVFLEK